MRVFYDTEREVIITESEIRNDWDCMTKEEQAEYDFSFGKYLGNCMVHRGGTLEEVRKSIS